MLLLYSESLGFITDTEVLTLAPDISEGGASKRARTAEGSDPLDFFGRSLNEEITGSDVNISLHIKSRLVDSLDNLLCVFFAGLSPGPVSESAISSLPACTKCVASIQKIKSRRATLKDRICTQ